MPDPGEQALWRCPRCGTEARFEGEELISLDIPGYEMRLREIERRVLEVTHEIQVEGAKGQARDMSLIRRLHGERQDLLAEFSFLTHFEDLVERHRRG